MSFNSNISVNSSLVINSPLEQFEITNLISFNAPILGYFNITITNLALYATLVIVLVTGLHLLANNQTKLLPSKWSIFLETLFATISTIVREQLGKEVYLPFIYSLFFFILISNLIGNIPYTYTITTSVIVTLGMSITIVTGVTILSLSIHGLKFFSYFVPSGTPLGLVPLLVLIETVSYLARAASLGVRLFANMVAGHALLKILSTFLFKMFASSILLAIVTLIPFSIFIALIGLELVVSFIQAYVFTLLTCSYIKDAIDLH